VKLISWNVNGIRSIARNGFEEWLSAEAPDVLCVQETKAQPDQLNQRLRQPPGYYTYWHSAQRKGYSGVATLCRTEPVDVQAGFGEKEFDNEGRVLITWHPGFALLNAYFPNGKRDHGRLDYKLHFYADLLAYCDTLLAGGEQLVICGDLNTAHQPMDLARPHENAKTSGFLPEERQWIDRYLAQGFVDIFRFLHPDEPDHYTWWSYATRARARNVGWRIDYFMISQALTPAVVDATILSDVGGSDHCPVKLELDTGLLPRF